MKTTRAIVSSILALAEGLKMDTIAEGIETEEQLTLLREAGCPLGQGFHFSKLLSQEGSDLLVEEDAPHPSL